MFEIAEFTAAPHRPRAMQNACESHALADFMSLLAAAGELQVIEEEGGLRLVAYPAG